MAIKKSTLVKIFLPLGFLAFLISPLRGNVCLSQFRLADEQEQIEAALDYYVEDLSRMKKFHVSESKYHLITPKFTTKANFKSRFPNCCRVLSVPESEKIDANWENWMTGDTAAFVDIVFSVPYLGDANESLTIKHRQQIPVSSCGAIESDVFYFSIGELTIFRTLPQQ